ncbi:hypothetical protein PYW08_001599 [Mythimna loreyi]|uniref:Uncharacterized protein n=1 Tax=Mythimna loreyi TaxID=667449 RepID=A0ACC2R9S7_9NEOP|nr:hypothetical protein PYW08_001599 [Mythimna loreyi]
MMSILFSIVFVNAFILFLIKVFYKLSTGICKCSNHLVGKVTIVTGGNKGIGYETAKNLAERGARVILACRNEGLGIAARDKIIKATGNTDVHYRQLDLSSLASVRAFADGVIKTEKRLDILINNAGVYEVDNVKSEDGLSVAAQTNHFGPFLLTNLLLPLLKTSAPSRIVTVSSGAHRNGKVEFDNLNGEKETKESYSMFNVYCNTKLYNVLMTVELQKRLEGTGVTANCLHPGVVETEILQLNSFWVRMLLPLARYFFKDSWEGAQTSIYLAVSREVDGVSGKYYVDCKESKFLTPLAEDKNLARKFWEVSEKLVGLK